MRKMWILSLVLAVTVSATVSASQKIDLSNAKIVVLNPKKKIMANAADILCRVGENAPKDAFIDGSSHP